MTFYEISSNPDLIYLIASILLGGFVLLFYFIHFVCKGVDR